MGPPAPCARAGQPPTAHRENDEIAAISLTPTLCTGRQAVQSILRLYQPGAADPRRSSTRSRRVCASFQVSSHAQSARSRAARSTAPHLRVMRDARDTLFRNCVSRLFAAGAWGLELDCLGPGAEVAAATCSGPLGPRKHADRSWRAWRPRACGAPSGTIDVTVVPGPWLSVPGPAEAPPGPNCAFPHAAHFMPCEICRVIASWAVVSRAVLPVCVCRCVAASAPGGRLCVRSRYFHQYGPYLFPSC